MAKRRVNKRVLEGDDSNNQKAKRGPSVQLNQADLCPTNGQLVYRVRKLGFEFFNRACTEVAASMLGKLMVRKFGGETGTAKEIVVRIVETEAYLGVVDRASHSYGGRQTSRNAAMFMNPGTAYVYNIYGMYQCINISTLEQGSAVLIRAAEAIAGISEMTAARRSNRRRCDALKLKDLCNGPSKLCQALNITKLEFDRHDLVSSAKLYLADDGFQTNVEDVVACRRIGIDYAKEWADKPLRFCLRGNPFVSIKPS